jgi:hypothetical protein
MTQSGRRPRRSGRSGFLNEIGKLAGALGDIEESFATRVPRGIAQKAVRQLQEIGPAWSGTFRNAWRIEAGDTTIPAVIVSDYDFEPGDGPNPEERRDIFAPPVGVGRRFGATLLKTKTLFTIGNAAVHRDVALDLVPGRLRSDERGVKVGGTAPQDWFINYMQGGPFDAVVQVEVDRALRSVRL